MIDYIKKNGTKKFEYNYELEIVNEKTPDTWTKNNLKNQLSIFDSGQSIEIQSITYILNLTIPTFILLISSIFKDFILTAELGIVIGINIILTQIFSSNSRSILISKKIIF